MKSTTMNTRLVRTAMAGLAFAAFGEMQAQSFAFANNDLLLAFRRDGSPNLEVNIGSISAYRGAAPNSSFTLTGYTATQLTTAFTSLNSLSWAVLGASRVGATPTDVPANTLWVTRPRTIPTDETVPFNSRSSSSQSSVSSKIFGIAGINAIAGAKPWSAGTALDAIHNNATSVMIPEADPSSYTALAGKLGNLGGTFGSNYGGGGVENTTPSAFTAGYSASDLYEIQPGSGQATELGTFRFYADGSATFTAVPEPGTYAAMFAGGLVVFAFLRKRRSALESASVSQA